MSDEGPTPAQPVPSETVNGAVPEQAAEASEQGVPAEVEAIKAAVAEAAQTDAGESELVEPETPESEPGESESAEVLAEATPAEPAEPVEAEVPEAVPAEDSAPEPPAPTHRRYDLESQHDEALRAAAEAIAAGECIVLPTDTVYGIGANASDAQAVQRLLNAKQRGRDMPPPVLIAEPAMLGALVAEIPAVVWDVVERHWPGALTIILKAASHLRMDLGQTAGTIAVRVPDHEATRELLRHTGPLAVSSANISGRPPAVEIDEAIDMLGDEVAVYLDAGTSPGGVASTIIDFSTSTNGRIIRKGALSWETLREVAPDLRNVFPGTGTEFTATPATTRPDEALTSSDSDDTEAVPAEAAQPVTEPSAESAPDAVSEPAPELAAESAPAGAAPDAASEAHPDAAPGDAAPRPDEPVVHG